MVNQSHIYMEIAKIGICITSPVMLIVPREMQPFVVDRCDPTVHYQVSLIDTPIIPEAPFVHNDSGVSTHPDGDGWLRVYSYLEGPDGVPAALRLRPDNHHTLYIPKSDLARYQSSNALSPILGLDYVMMLCSCMFLHSSLLRYQGKAVLFSGPSGVGKSTQAGLWEKHLGAEILNGDKSCIAKRADGFYACGSPYAGSSDIFLQEEAPICGIVLLNQGSENRITQVSGRQAFIPLYAQMLANTWDGGYTDTLCNLLDELLSHVPVYALTCKADSEAVRLVRDTLFDGIG